MKEEKNKVGRPRLADTNLKKNSIIMIEIAMIGIISLIIGGILTLTNVNSSKLRGEIIKYKYYLYDYNGNLVDKANKEEKLDTNSAGDKYFIKHVYYKKLKVDHFSWSYYEPLNNDFIWEGLSKNAESVSKVKNVMGNYKFNIYDSNKIENRCGYSDLYKKNYIEIAFNVNPPTSISAAYYNGREMVRNVFEGYHKVSKNYKYCIDDKCEVSESEIYDEDNVSKGKHQYKIYYFNNFSNKYVLLKQGSLTCKKGTSSSTEKGWKKENGKWYYYKNGKKLVYLQKINGKYYYFNSKGEMQKGFIKFNKDGKYRYFSKHGYMVTNKCVKINGERYCFSKSGICTQGSRCGITTTKPTTKKVTVATTKGVLKLNCPKTVKVNQVFTCTTNMSEVKFTVSSNGLASGYNPSFTTTNNDKTKQSKYTTAGVKYISVEKTGYKPLTKKVTVKPTATVGKLTLNCPTTAKANQAFKCSTNIAGASISITSGCSLASGYNWKFTTTSSDKVKWTKCKNTGTVYVMAYYDADGRQQVVNKKVELKK